MPSEKEIEAAAKAIYEQKPYDKSYMKAWAGLCDIATRKNNGYNYIAIRYKEESIAAAKAALEAAEQERQDMHTELVEALRACIGVIVEYTEYEHSGDPWEEDARAMGEMSIDDFKQEGKLQDVIDLLLKATKEEG